MIFNIWHRDDNHAKPSYSLKTPHGFHARDLWLDCMARTTLWRDRSCRFQLQGRHCFLSDMHLSREKDFPRRRPYYCIAGNSSTASESMTKFYAIRSAEKDSAPHGKVWSAAREIFLRYTITTQALCGCIHRAMNLEVINSWSSSRIHFSEYFPQKLLAAGRGLRTRQMLLSLI